MLVLDFSKAFDTVAHKRLLGKLESYGIDGNLYGWIQSFLEGRTQRVVVDGETSGPASVKSGILQGSVLGPLLFLIFINDLAEHTTSTVRLFADDCVMYKSVKSVRDCQELQVTTRSHTATSMAREMAAEIQPKEMQYHESQTCN